MLLFDDSKKLEKALGEEAAAVIVHVFEKMSDDNKRELATRAELELRLAETETRLTAEIARAKSELAAEIAKSRAETIKWTAGLLIAQAAVVATLVKLL
jgi:hypothetical protein